MRSFDRRIKSGGAHLCFYERADDYAALSHEEIQDLKDTLQLSIQDEKLGNFNTDLE